MLAFFKFSCCLYFVMLFVGANGKNLKAKLVTASKCDLPASRLSPDQPVHYNITTKKLSRHKTVFNANFSIPHKYGPVTFAGRAYQIKQNAAKDLVFKLENINCHNPFMFQIIRLANISYDRDCYFPPGEFKVENLDLNDYKWIMSKSLISSGKYAYEWEFSDPKGIVACVFVVCEIIM